MGKKLAYLIVAFSLILTGVISFSLKGTGSIAGSGLGTGKQIEKIEDYLELSDYVGTLGLGFNEDSNSKFKSATLHVNSSSSTDYESSNPKYTYGTISEKGEYEEDVTVHITSKAVYMKLHHSSYWTEKHEVDEDDYKTVEKRYSGFLRYNVEVYITAKKGYIKINDYNASDNTYSQVIKAEYTGKWIEISENIFDRFIDRPNALNDIGSIYEILFRGLENDVIDEDDTSVSLNESDVAELVGIEDEEVDDYNIDFSVDLSDKYRPHASLGVSLDSTESMDYPTNNGVNVEHVEIKTSGKAVSDLTIYDINNTEINWNGSDVIDKISVDSYEEFEDLFIIEKYEED